MAIAVMRKEAMRYARISQVKDFHEVHEPIKQWAEASADQGAGALHRVTSRGLRTPDGRIQPLVSDPEALMQSKRDHWGAL